MPPTVDPRWIPSTDEERWMPYAACLDEDPDLFFPLGNKSNSDRAQILKAKNVCAGCPVINQCTERMGRIRADYGVFAGLDEWERVPSRTRGSRGPVRPAKAS